jgi:hypothetical protein
MGSQKVKNEPRSEVSGLAGVEHRTAIDSRRCHRRLWFAISNLPLNDAESLFDPRGSDRQNIATENLSINDMGHHVKGREGA